MTIEEINKARRILDAKAVPGPVGRMLHFAGRLYRVTTLDEHGAVHVEDVTDENSVRL